MNAIAYARHREYAGLKFFALRHLKPQVIDFIGGVSFFAHDVHAYVHIEEGFCRK